MKKLKKNSKTVDQLVDELIASNLTKDQVEAIIRIILIEKQRSFQEGALHALTILNDILREMD